MSFQDHFSKAAAGYASFRPTYPPALFEFLAGVVLRRRVAWDCATGSGQAARGLATHFERVVATDASAQQIAQAIAHPRITYRIARAEESGLELASLDLVTVAQALHWFDLDAFYAEARRVLLPGGALAVWSYGDPYLEEPALDRVLQRFNHETVGAFWLPARDVAVDGYRGLPFPFEELATPDLVLEHTWPLAQLTGYVRTWSASTRFAAQHGIDAVTSLEAELCGPWGDPSLARTVRWPLRMRVGRG